MSIIFFRHIVKFPWKLFLKHLQNLPYKYVISDLSLTYPYLINIFKKITIYYIYSWCYTIGIDVSETQKCKHPL